MLKKLLKVSEVTEYLGIARRSLMRLIKEKEIPAFKVGNQWRFDPDTIKAWTRENTLQNLSRK